MEHIGTKRIETDRLILRRFTPDDAQAMYDNWCSDPEVTKYLMWQTYTDVSDGERVLAEWCRDYEKRDFYVWAITLKDHGDEPIGSISVVEHDDMTMMAHIGYCIGRKWWHKGIMTEALGAVIDYMFDRVGMERVESRHDPNNPHSGGVMRKCGMTYEGTLRRADWNNQGICDASVYSILRDERTGGKDKTATL